MNRAPFRREHTGQVAMDRLQRSPQELAVRLGAVQDTIEAREIGSLLFHMDNKRHVLTPAQARYGLIRLLGTLTAARKIVYPTASYERAYTRWVSNNTSGGFAVLAGDSHGSVSVAAGTTRLVLFWGQAPAFLV